MSALSSSKNKPEFIEPLTDPTLVAYDRLELLVWIADIDDWTIYWANKSTLTFWNEPNLKNLVNRKMSVSDTVRTMHYHVRELLKEQPFVRMEQTVYPDGRAPVRLAFTYSPYLLPNGRTGFLVEARPVHVADPEVVRRMDAVRYAPLVVTTHTHSGMTLSANGLGRSTFGDWFDFVSMFVDAEAGKTSLTELVEGGSLSVDAELKTLQGRRWFAMEGRRIVDPITGLSALLLSAHDVTARREAERAKDEIVSVVSHELRTPLTSIRGALDLLAGGVVSGNLELEKEMIGIARENVARLNKMVDDLLDVQRLAAGVVELSLAPIDLVRLCARTIELHRPSATLAQVHIDLKADSQVVCLVDINRIEQVLSNLLSNAMKHSEAGQRVRVEVVRARDKGRVSVSDEGPGVPKEFRNRIFSAFSQADASDTRPRGGTGLGLYIARTLIERHGGTLSFDETAEKGAHFFFELACVSSRENKAATKL